MTLLFLKYRFRKLIRSFRGAGGITMLILAGSVAWVGFLLVDSSSLRSDQTSANLTSGVNPVIIQKNVEINILARQVIEQELDRMSDAGITYANNSQIVRDTLSNIVKEIQVGDYAVTFIIDQRGHVVAHPDLDPQGEIQDYSNQPDVKKAVDNQEGTDEVSIGNDTYLSSFRPLSPYGWGVITRVKIR